MMYFASDMFFGNKDVSLKRHYITPDEMSSEIIVKWNKTVCPDDEVFILGGVGEMSFLKSLNGRKSLLMSDYEEKHMKEYVSGISKIRDPEIDGEMYSFYMKSEFGVSSVVYSGKSIQKIYSGRTVYLNSMPDTRTSKDIIICGLMGEYHRVYKNGINANIYLNGMYPISEIEVEEMTKHLNPLW